MFRVVISTCCLAVAAAVALAPAAANAAPYPNCKTAKADHVCDIPSSSPMYGPWLDGDHDGIGCEC
jgi:excalibur calcium-binding domain-containing protein